MMCSSVHQRWMICPNWRSSNWSAKGHTKFYTVALARRLAPYQTQAHHNNQHTKHYHSAKMRNDTTFPGGVIQDVNANKGGIVSFGVTNGSSKWRLEGFSWHSGIKNVHAKNGLLACLWCSLFEHLWNCLLRWTEEMNFFLNSDSVSDKWRCH